MTDDPLYGDRPKPPLVPMSSGEVVGFDILQAAMSAPPRRRWPWAVALVVLVAALALVVRQANAGTVTRVHSPQEALSDLCAQYRSAERSFTTGSTSSADFERSLDALARTSVTLQSPSLTRFETDLSSVDDQFSTYGDIGGPTTTDLHAVCGY